MQQEKWRTVPRVEGMPDICDKDAQHC